MSGHHEKWDIRLKWAENLTRVLKRKVKTLGRHLSHLIKWYHTFFPSLCQTNMFLGFSVLSIYISGDLYTGKVYGSMCILEFIESECFSWSIIPIIVMHMCEKESVLCEWHYIIHLNYDVSIIIKFHKCDTFVLILGKTLKVDVIDLRCFEMVL